MEGNNRNIFEILDDKVEGLIFFSFQFFSLMFRLIAVKF